MKSYKEHKHSKPPDRVASGVHSNFIAVVNAPFDVNVVLVIGPVVRSALLSSCRFERWNYCVDCSCRCNANNSE